MLISSFIYVIYESKSKYQQGFIMYILHTVALSKAICFVLLIMPKPGKQI